MATNKPTQTPGEKEGARQDQSSFNGSYTAIPKSVSSAGTQDVDLDLAATPMDAGEMNRDDALESGYMDEDGRAVSQQKADREGSPTGAYTDVGAGRSSAVRSSKNTKKPFS